MAKSDNFDELEYTWNEWHNSTGPLMKPYFKKYIELSNKAAKLNGYNDAGEMWRAKYEDPHFIENLKKLWHTVEPLYKELHQYTRNKLIKIYGKRMLYILNKFNRLTSFSTSVWISSIGDRMDPNDKNIPAHLCGISFCIISFYQYDINYYTNIYQFEQYKIKIRQYVVSNVDKFV